MKIKLALVAMTLVLTGCEPRHNDIVDASPQPLASAVQTAACFDETMAVPSVCDQLVPLPECLAEDDAQDGTAGPACWWRDRDSGLWYNDGDGRR